MLMPSDSYRFGDWLVEPQLNCIRRGRLEERLEPLSMDLLRHMLEHPHEILSVEHLLDAVWSGRVVEPNAVHRGISSIRRALGDEPRHPRYIETIPKRGYRAIAVVSPLTAATPLEEGLAAPPVSAIAVMPFDDLSPNVDHAWLAEGMAEELIESLSRIQGLRVPARSSTSILKERRAPIEEIAGCLRVGSLVTGSIRKSGNRICVTAQWIRADNHIPIWTARYEREIKDVLAIQMEIAAGIAESIRRELGIHDAVEFLSRSRYQTSNVKAWEFFRRGAALAFTFIPKKMLEGREYLHQALELDPDYLDARAWLAWSDFDHPQEAIDVARQILEKQPSNSRALMILIDDSQTQWDFESAEHLWKYAITSNPPTNVFTLCGYHLSSCLGRVDDTLEIAQRGIRLDPLWSTQHFFLGLAHLNMGNASAAIDPIRKAMALLQETGAGDGMMSWFCRSLAVAYQAAGRQQEALDAMQQAFPAFRGEIMQGWRAGGWRSANLGLAEAFRRRMGNRAIPGVARTRASLLASAGERAGMYEQLRQIMDFSQTFSTRDREALRSCQFLAEALRVSAEFRPYREEPQFQELIQQLINRMIGAAGTSGHASRCR